MTTLCAIVFRCYLVAGAGAHFGLNSASWGMSVAGDVACLLLLTHYFCTAYALTVAPTMPSPSQVTQPVTGSLSRVVDPQQNAV